MSNFLSPGKQFAFFVFIGIVSWMVGAVVGPLIGFTGYSGAVIGVLSGLVTCATLFVMERRRKSKTELV